MRAGARPSAPFRSRRKLNPIESPERFSKDAPLRLHVLGSMSDDLEDWEHVLEGVRESTGRVVDGDTVQREVESLIAEGLVEPFAFSPPGPEGRLVPTKADSSRLRDEETYWFFPTEAGMRFYCDAIGAPFPAHRFAKPI